MNALEELRDDLWRRGKACRALTRETSNGESQARLMGKASAYDHAAELLSALISNPTDGGGA